MHSYLAGSAIARQASSTSARRRASLSSQLRRVNRILHTVNVYVLYFQKPQDAAERLNSSVTFNCSAGNGSHDVIWSSQQAGTLILLSQSMPSLLTYRVNSI